MSEVIDVVTRLTYEANLAPLEKSIGLTEQNADAVVNLINKQNQLEKELSETNSANLNQINKLTKAIGQLQQQYDKQISTLQKDIATQQKLIESLNKQGAATDVLAAKQQKLQGSSQRATQSLTDLGRIVQDAPYGIRGIANNIVPALEGFQRLNRETGSFGGALKALGTSLIGAGGIGFAVSAISSLLVVFGDKLFSSSKKTDEAAEALKKYKGALDGAETSARQSAQSEIARIEVLTSIASDVTQSTRQRELAIKELQKEYPAYFGNLDKEILLQGQAKAAIDGATQALLNRAAATAAEKKFALAAERVYDLTQQLKAANKEVEDAFKRTEENTGDDVDPLLSGIVRQGISIARERRDAIAKQREQAREEQKGYLQDAKDFAKAAGETIFKDSTLKEPKTKAPKERKSLILPDIKDDLDEMANEIQYGTERVDIQLKALQDVFLKRLLNDPNVEDAFKDYAKSIGRGITSFEAEILEGLSPGGNSAGLAASIRKYQADRANKISELQSQYDKLAGKKNLTAEEQLQKKILLLKASYLEKAGQLVQQSVTLAASVANAQIEIEIQKQDAIISIQSRRVEQATELAKRGNAEILRQEQERLDEATRAREKAAKKQVQLNALVQASNSALAVTSAIKGILEASATTAAEGGGIIGYVASIIAGLAAVASLYFSIKSATGGFAKGGYTGDGDKYEPAGTVHKGEFVFSKEATRKYGVPFLEAMHEGRLSPRTEAFASGGHFRTEAIEKRLDRVAEAVEGLTFSASQNVDKHGVNQMVQTTMKDERLRWRR